MVTPSPFDRMLQQASQQAAQDPAAAFAQLEALFGKSLTDQDVRNLAGLSAHIGGAMLGRWADTAAFLRRCLEHPAVEKDGDSARSIWRALSVIHTCAGQEAEATDAFAAGVRNAGEHCRMSVICAQMLVARRELIRAVPHLEKAAELCAELPAGDEVLTQVAAIGANIARNAEATLTSARNLLLAADAASAAACARLGDWRSEHKALFQQGRGFVAAGRPVPALGVVQRLMALEEANQAGPVERFFSASLACRAQMLRGQMKVAAGAYQACRDLAGQVEDAKAREMVEKALTRLTDDLAADKAERDRWQG